LKNSQANLATLLSSRFEGPAIGIGYYEYEYDLLELSASAEGVATEKLRWELVIYMPS
jgi:hypothetical protein